MPNLTQLRLAAREIFDEALSAVDAGEAIRGALQIKGSQLTVRDMTVDLGNKSVFSIAIGKAALPMAIALEGIVGEKLAAGVLAGPGAGQPAAHAMQKKLSSRWQRYEGGHPLPTEASLSAASAAFVLLD